MKYYIIYSFDTQKDQSVKAYQPSQLHKWDMTEDDSEYQYNYLGGEWEHGKHRKYVRLIESREEFREFLWSAGLRYEDVETMGSLTGFGWLPAFSFISDDYNAIQNAYVTPIPINQGRSEEESKIIWDGLKNAFLRKYK